MLKLEPGSATAANGLKRLSRQYEQRARASQKAGSLTASLSRVREGLAYFPDHSGLRSLLEELTDPARIQERKANRLLRKAKKQLAALRLTTPAGNNAYESYRRVLALFPNNLEAQVGLKNIADRYLRFARGMPDEPEKARQMIGKGLLVMPDHLELLALKQQRFDKPDKPRNKESNAQAEDVQSERVKRLSHTAARHVAAKEFDAAAEKYKNILALVPDNAPALQGLEQIAGQYEILARAQQRAGKLPESLMMAAKGLGVSPQHPGLSALQKELTSQINANTQSKPSVEPILLTPSF
ncbi:MAG: hypothetical protein GY862_35435 [Gammaproteobacteria bacterium]|nr:hypothetical protein [Gammaproteobacteria bacterium]